MSDLNETMLPPPPPPVVSPHELEELEAMIFDLKRQMEMTNIRVRFKMSTYEQWCERVENIWLRIKEIRSGGSSVR